MSDELNQDAEFTGTHEGNEDPILVAQRYLNIFHQIHIFNDKRKKEFDDSLLELPSNIRILLSTLPGGSILIDHIANLEEKENQKHTQSSFKNYDLAKPSVDHNFQSSVKTKEKESNIKQNVQNPEVSASSNAISSDILSILKQNELQHAKDMEMLFEMMVRSQENIANTLKEALSAQAVAVQTVAAEKNINPVLDEPENKPTPKPEDEQEKDIIQDKQVASDPIEEKVEKEIEEESALENKKNEKNKKKDKKDKKEKNKDNNKQDSSISATNHSDNQKSTDLKEKTKENSSVSETGSETKNSIFNLTKKIFTTLKSSSEKNTVPEIDQTPVSLDDFTDTPVSLNDHSQTETLKSDLNDLPPIEEKNQPTNSEFSSNVQNTEQLSNSSNNDEDWDWEYIEDSDDDSDDDSEWEYVEEPSDTILPQETNTSDVAPQDPLPYKDTTSDINSYDTASDSYNITSDSSLPDEQFNYDTQINQNPDQTDTPFSSETDHMDNLLDQFASQNDPNLPASDEVLDSDALLAQYADQNNDNPDFADQFASQNDPNLPASDEVLDSDALLAQYADQNNDNLNFADQFASQNDPNLPASDEALDSDALLAQYTDQNNDNTDSLLSQFSYPDDQNIPVSDENLDSDALLAEFADNYNGNTSAPEDAMDTDALLAQFADQNQENTDSLVNQLNSDNKEDKA